MNATSSQLFRLTSVAASIAFISLPLILQLRRQTQASSSSSKDTDDDDTEKNHKKLTAKEGDGVFDAVRLEYQRMASWYDWFWRSYTNETLKKPIYLAQQAMSKAANNNKFVLVDIGCGTGEFLKRLRQETTKNDVTGPIVEYMGVEPSQEMLEKAHEKLKQFTDVSLQQSPAESLPFSQSIANIVASTSAFHFFRDKPQALQQMERILKPEGALIITDWCNDYTIVKLYHLMERLRWNLRFHEPYPRPLTSTQLLEMVKAAGFESVDLEKYTVQVWLVDWGMQTITAKKLTAKKHN